MGKIIAGLLAISLLSTVFAANFTGSYTTNWGVVELRQSGDKVTGTYSVPAPGEIEGRVDSGVMTYRWLQSNGVWGMGNFRLMDDGRKIRGTWGTGKSAESGGIWEGKRN